VEVQINFLELVKNISGAAVSSVAISGAADYFTELSNTSLIEL
jgi:hypothetical protein